MTKAGLTLNESSKIASSTRAVADRLFQGSKPSGTRVMVLLTDGLANDISDTHINQIRGEYHTTEGRDARDV